MINLEGQVAIITGGAQGIGEGVCKVFCDAGATVALWDVRDSGAETAAKLKDDGGKIFFQKVDITNREAVDAAVNEIISAHSKIDILINNAGIVRDKSILKMTQEEWDAVINVNLSSLFTTTQAVLPHMREARYGRIISASSINGFAGAFGQTNYSASKAPGFIETEMTSGMPEEIIKAGIAMIPVARIGTAEDMGYAYLYLASKQAGFINGVTLHANGGAMPM
jgi:3-oxoacyl-[acyl-carrier protein] reductase